MTDKMVLKTAKNLNKEKYNLDKLNNQILLLKEKEEKLKQELRESEIQLSLSKKKEEEIKEVNSKVKVMAKEEMMKNKNDHNELVNLREMKKMLQKDLNRVMQENLKAKYELESLRETTRSLENNVQNLQGTYNETCKERDDLNDELMKYKQEYDELMQIYELKKSEDAQLKQLYNFHFNQ